MSAELKAIVLPDGDEEDVAPARPYRAISGWAVLSIAFGLISPLLFFHWTFVALPLLGVYFGWMGLRQVQRSTTEVTGGIAALSGIGLSLLLGSVGLAALVFSEGSYVPFGYQPITFDQLQPDVARAGELLPAAADKLDKERVFIRGYMYPGRQVSGLREFILVPTQDHCSFCTRQLRSTEMINVTMAADMAANYSTRLIGVGGRFHLKREEAVNPFGGLPYQMEADYVR